MDSKLSRRSFIAVAGAGASIGLLAPRRILAAEQIRTLKQLPEPIVTEAIIAPDGRSICVAAGSARQQALYVGAYPSPSHYTKIADSADTLGITAIAWSPQQPDQIAFAARQSDGTIQIATVRSDGTQRQEVSRITEGSGGRGRIPDVSLCFTSDGKAVAFASKGRTVRRVGLAGSDNTVIYSAADKNVVITRLHNDAAGRIRFAETQLPQDRSDGLGVPAAVTIDDGGRVLSRTALAAPLGLRRGPWFGKSHYAYGPKPGAAPEQTVITVYRFESPQPVADLAASSGKMVYQPLALSPDGAELLCARFEPRRAAQLSVELVGLDLR